MEGRQGVATVRWAGLSDPCTHCPPPQALAMTSGAHWPNCVRSTCGVSICAVQHLSSSSSIRPTTSSTSQARWAGLQPQQARPQGPNPPSSPPTPRYGTRCTGGSCAYDPLPKAT